MDWNLFNLSVKNVFIDKTLCTDKQHGTFYIHPNLVAGSIIIFFKI